MKRFEVLILAASLTWPLLVHGQKAPPALALLFSDSALMVSDATRGGRVYVFSVAREPKGYYTNVAVQEAVLHDDDGDGRVQWDFPSGLPVRSVWLAVDVTSGASAAAPRPDYTATRTALTEKHLKNDVTGEIERLGAEGGHLEFIVVRPSVGIWGARVFLRGPKDQGTEDDQVAVSLLDLDRRAGTIEPPPKHLKKDDVVFILNSVRGQYVLAAVGK